MSTSISFFLCFSSFFAPSFSVSIYHIFYLRTSSKCCRIGRITCYSVERIGRAVGSFTVRPDAEGVGVLLIALFYGDAAVIGRRCTLTDRIRFQWCIAVFPCDFARRRRDHCHRTAYIVQDECVAAGV